jgi:hypothetical protein
MISALILLGKAKSIAALAGKGVYTPAHLEA